MKRHKRRYRQIGRLLYYYCCVRYMTRENGTSGAWVESELLKSMKKETLYEVWDALYGK